MDLSTLPIPKPVLLSLVGLLLPWALATFLPPVNRRLAAVVARVVKNKAFLLGYGVFLALKDGNISEEEAYNLLPPSVKEKLKL